MNASIGLFGGTFDPVHNGHLSIADAFVQSGFIDELWVLLTPDPPHKTQKVHAPFIYRERMLEQAFEGLSSVSISTIENILPRPTYTIQTLEYITRNHPGHRYSLCIGEDSLVHFSEWYRYREILDYCDLIVARRPGFDAGNIDDRIKKHVQFVDHEPVDISSSEIRSMVQKGEDVTEYLPEAVIEIIQNNGLYQSDH